MDCQPIKFYDSGGRVCAEISLANDGILTVQNADEVIAFNGDDIITPSGDGTITLPPCDLYYLPEQDARSITQPSSKPNRWRRFWHWALLGWRWVDGAGWGTEQ